MKRPHATDDAVIAEVVKLLLPDVLSWLKSGGDADPDEAEVIEDLTRAIDDSFDLDAYKLAKALEDNAYWSPDESLVEELSAASSHAHAVIDRMTKEWVIAEGIQPQFAVGSRVMWRHSRSNATGTITFIKTETAHYTIQEDGGTYTSPNCGWIVPFEKAHEIPA